MKEAYEIDWNFILKSQIQQVTGEDLVLCEQLISNILVRWKNKTQDVEELQKVYSKNKDRMIGSVIAIVDLVQAIGDDRKGQLEKIVLKTMEKN